MFDSIVGFVRQKRINYLEKRIEKVSDMFENDAEIHSVMDSFGLYDRMIDDAIKVYELKEQQKEMEIRKHYKSNNSRTVKGDTRMLDYCNFIKGDVDENSNDQMGV